MGCGFPRVVMWGLHLLLDWTANPPTRQASQADLIVSCDLALGALGNTLCNRNTRKGSFEQQRACPHKNQHTTPL